MSNSPVCVDASFIVRMMLRQERDEVLWKTWSHWCMEGRPVVAPNLLWYEMTNALYQYVKHGHVGAGDAIQILALALQLGITLYGDMALHEQALLLASQWSLPATYDAHYLALAESLGADLWTADRRLARAVSPTLEWVHLADDILASD